MKRIVLFCLSLDIYFFGMAFTRVFLVFQLIALAYSANWLDDPELVEEERALVDQNSITWLDEIELDEDNVSDSGIEFLGSELSSKGLRGKKNKETSEKYPQLACENLWQDKYCDVMIPLCKSDDQDSRMDRKRKREVRTHCRKSCDLCEAKKSTKKYVTRIEERENALLTCEDTAKTRVCKKFQDKCTTGGMSLRVKLQMKCRKTCGFC